MSPTRCNLPPPPAYRFHCLVKTEPRESHTLVFIQSFCFHWESSQEWRFFLQIHPMDDSALDVDFWRHTSLSLYLPLCLCVSLSNFTRAPKTHWTIDKSPFNVIRSKSRYSFCCIRPQAILSIFGACTQKQTEKKSHPHRSVELQQLKVKFDRQWMRRMICGLLALFCRRSLVESFILFLLISINIFHSPFASRPNMV